ncbi:MAG: NUDIX domain-containing protein, partial [Proteobacteria bacterium]|nr:NUDIX domain-containing protein [Pseudomonadota bacterium]
PDCGACPWRPDCAALARNLTAILPNRAPAPPRPTRHGVAFWLACEGTVLLRRRPPSGLLGGMLELPGTPWGDAPWSDSAASAFAPAGVRWQRRGTVRHTFTHFHLELAVLAGRTTSAAAIPALWTPATDAGLAPLPTVTKKAARLALATPVPCS